MTNPHYWNSSDISGRDFGDVRLVPCPHGSVLPDDSHDFLHARQSRTPQASSPPQASSVQRRCLVDDDHDGHARLPGYRGNQKAAVFSDVEPQKLASSDVVIDQGFV